MPTTLDVGKRVIKVNTITIGTSPSSLNWATDIQFPGAKQSNSNSILLAWHSVCIEIISANESVTTCTKTILKQLTFTTRKKNIFRRMEGHNTLSCLRISTGNHNLVLHEDRSRPPLLSLKSIWIILLCIPIYAVFLQEASCLTVFQLKFCTNFFLPCVPHAPPISSSLI